MIKTTRICAGEYVVRESTDIRPSREVRVTRVYYPSDGVYWIAASCFDNTTSDPLLTKREAVATAKYILNAY